MFNNPFLKKDSLLEAVKEAQAEGELRRMAEAHVNEQFGVYSRKAVVREDLAAYDAAIEEAVKCMKEGKPVLANKDYDGDGKIESGKAEYQGSRIAAAKRAGKLGEGNVSLKDVRDADAAQNPSGYAAMRNKSEDQALERAGKGLARDIKEKKMWEGQEDSSSGLPPSAAATQAAKQTPTPPATPKKTSTSDLSSTFSSARGAAGMQEANLDEATRKHFRAHAEDISKISDQEERNKAATAAASTYARLNPRFDHAKFHKAAGSTAHQPEKVNEERWIQAALSKKTKGALHKDLNVSQKKKIPLSKLKAASDDPGKTGKRARLAMTLRKLHEKLESDSFKAAQGTGKSVNEVAMGMPPAITPPAIIRPASSTKPAPGMKAPTGSFRGLGAQPFKATTTQASSGGGYDIAARMSASGRQAAASKLGGMNAVDRIGGAIKSATTSSAGSSAKAMVDGGRAAISRGVGALGAGARVARGAVGGPTGAALTAASIAAPYVAAKMSASHKAGHSSFTGTHQQTPDVKASDSFARMRQMSQTSTASSTPAASKPAIDPTAKGAKYAGGNVHNVTTLKQTAPGDQAQIQSVKTEKGWADPGRWENEVKSKTGAMQQIRTTPDRHVVDTPTQQVGRPSASSEKSTSNFLQSQGIGSSASTQSSETPAKASVNFNKKAVQENDEKAKSPKPMMTTFSPAAPMGNLPKMSDHPPSSLKEEVTVGNNKYRIV